MAKTCKEYFDKMPGTYQKEVGAKLNCLYQFDLAGDGGGMFFVQIKNGELTVGEGQKPDPDVTLVAAAKDYVDIAEGRLSEMLALATGRFKIKGNMLLAMKLSKLFKR